MFHRAVALLALAAVCRAAPLVTRKMTEKRRRDEALKTYFLSSITQCVEAKGERERERQERVTERARVTERERE